MTNEKRETVIKWLQNEIRSLRLAPTINGCGPENWADLLEIMETCLEAVRGCFVDTNKTSPMTPEQLREMNGQPVWVKVIDTRFNEENQWAICNAEYQMVTLKDGFKLFFCGYGLNWLAYAYHPAHIDREAWKKCPWCKSEYTVIDDDFGQPVHPNMIKFCWNCGRPLTPEAWAELEKRLRGW